MDQFLRDFHENGFVQLSEPGLLDLIKIDEFKLLNVEERLRDNGEKDVSPELTKRLKSAAVYLQTKYLDEHFKNPKLTKFLVWQGVDYDNRNWHTDCFEGMDLFFLFYYDTMSEETKGGIEFRAGDRYWTVYPKAGDLFLVNNARGFFHRAQACDILRRVSSFDFVVDDE